MSTTTPHEPALVAAEHKAARARDLIRPLGRVAVALSGGVDSAVVLALAAEAVGRAQVLAVTARSPSMPQRELAEAAQTAQTLGVAHLVVDTHELADPQYARNDAQRCYFCKTELYSRVQPVLAKQGITALLNGANADDAGDYRPGMQAASEHRVQSPLLAAGLGKAEVRLLAATRGLRVADKPASPCLASRLAYGLAVTPERLHQVEQAEEVLRGLGLREFRVRHHDSVARIEVPPEDFGRVLAARGEVVAKLKALGFTYVALDLLGFRSGSGNDLIGLSRRVAPRTQGDAG